MTDPCPHPTVRPTGVCARCEPDRTVTAAAREPDGTYELRLPLPPNLANARTHWARKHKQRVAYFGACEDLRTFRVMPKPPRAPVDPARIGATLYVWNVMDQDNALARCKWAVDWCQRAGYIADDSPAHLTWDGVPEQVVDRKNQRLVLRIWPDTEGG